MKRSLIAQKGMSSLYLGKPLPDRNDWIALKLFIKFIWFLFFKYLFSITWILLITTNELVIIKFEFPEFNIFLHYPLLPRLF